MPLRPPVRVTAYAATSAPGAGNKAHGEAFRSHRSGFVPLASAGFWPEAADSTPHPTLATWVGCVSELDVPLPEPWARWACRNNRLARLGLQCDGFVASVRAATERHGAHRVAVVPGSSTASIGATEAAYRQQAAHGVFPDQPDTPRLHTLHSLSAFVQEALAVKGACHTVSTACSSGAKAFAAGERLLALENGLLPGTAGTAQPERSIAPFLFASTHRKADSHRDVLHVRLRRQQRRVRVRVRVRHTECRSMTGRSLFIEEVGFTTPHARPHSRAHRLAERRTPPRFQNPVTRTGRQRGDGSSSRLSVQ